MKLMTNALARAFQKPRETDGHDPFVLTKFFHPFSSWTWYPTEYDPDERLFFGAVDGHEWELGYFSLTELESVKVHGLGIERDLHWKPMRLSEVQRLCGRRSQG
ncbi:DUF2958 domain-containing protein [Bdellovibrionota bacterium FG-1]